jgi:hypothetical protein
MSDTLELSCELIRRASVTPEDADRLTLVYQRIIEGLLPGNA